MRRSKPNIIYLLLNLPYGILMDAASVSAAMLLIIILEYFDFHKRKS